MLNLRNMTEAELRQLNSSVVGELRQRRDEKNQNAKSQFRVGDSVKFAGRHGITVEGNITKINPKTIVVDGGINGSWKVSPSILEVK